jgi:DNA-binding transcriptional ArsR family regulator
MSVVIPADALADPVRRTIVERLAEGEVGAGDIAAAFPISRPAISRHLRVLREAGLVTSRVAGQQRIYALDRRPLAELDAWLERFRPLPAVPTAGPASRLDALDTEMHRGRRARRTADDRGDRHDRTAG